MRFLPPLLTRNWHLKLSALGLALLLWIVLRVEDTNRQDVAAVPVQVELADPDWALMGEPMPASVRVRFGGPSRELLRMAVDRPELIVPVDEVVAEDTTLVIQNQWIQIHDRTGVVVEDVEPRNLRLSFEPVERVTVALRPTTEGELPDHLAFSGDLVANPAQIRVIGPRSRLASLDTLALAPVELDGLDGPGSRTVDVDTANLGGLDFTPSEVTVILPVEERVERVLEDVPVEVEPAAWTDDVEVDPESVEVLLSGARSVMAALDPDRIRVVVDLVRVAERLGLPPDPEAVAAAGDGDADGQPEEVRIPLSLMGVPDRVDAELGVDSATVRRAPDP